MTILLDPTDERVPIARLLAGRSGRVRGPIALLDISKPRGDVFLDRLAERLQERLAGVELRRYAKPTFTRPAPEDLRRKITTECGSVIEALAD
jgi:hypothetical protein